MCELTNQSRSVYDSPWARNSSAQHYWGMGEKALKMGLRATNPGRLESKKQRLAQSSRLIRRSAKYRGSSIFEILKHLIKTIH